MKYESFPGPEQPLQHETAELAAQAATGFISCVEHYPKNLPENIHFERMTRSSLDKEMREQNIMAIDRATTELLGTEVHIERRYKESEGLLHSTVIHMEGGPNYLLPDAEDTYQWRFSFDSATQEVVEAEKEHAKSREKSELQNQELHQIASRVRAAWAQLSRSREY